MPDVFLPCLNKGDDDDDDDDMYCMPGGGGGVLPYKGLMGTCGQGMFFGIFVFNRVSNLSFFVLIRVSVYQFLS